MSPVGKLIEMQQRLRLHNALVRQQRRDHIKHHVMRQLDEYQREYDNMLQTDYDERFLKVDGREG